MLHLTHFIFFEFLTCTSILFYYDQYQTLVEKPTIKFIKSMSSLWLTMCVSGATSMGNSSDQGAIAPSPPT